MEIPSAYLEYKESETRYKQKLLGKSRFGEKTTTQRIEDGTQRAINRTERKFGKHPKHPRPLDAQGRERSWWLLSITEEQWFSCNEGEALGLGFARRALLIKALKIHLDHMRTDISSPCQPTGRSISWTGRGRHPLSNKRRSATDIELVRIGCRYCWAAPYDRVDLRGDTGKTEDAISFVRKETEVLHCLYACWGEQIWPAGIPKDLATAQAMLGKSRGRTEKLLDRGKPFVGITCLLIDRKDGLGDAIARSKWIESGGHHRTAR